MGVLVAATAAAVVAAVVATAAILLLLLLPPLLLPLLLLFLQKPHTWSPIGLLQIPHYFLLIPYHPNGVSSSGSSGLTASAGAT